MNNKKEIIIISVNDTIHPRTGGMYVYKVIKEELIRNGYFVNEISVPILLNKIYKNGKYKDIVRVLLHVRCTLESFYKRLFGDKIIITSSHPAFPVFGHIVYHQPKAGTASEFGREYLDLLWKIGWMIVENEKLSPLWMIAKHSHIIHLSNSFFTKKLIKKLYGIESYVVYPPVPLPPINSNSIKKERKFGVIVSRPNLPSGIINLPRIVSNMPKNIKIVIIGNADRIGLAVIKSLKKKGINIRYLGYVNNDEKNYLFSLFTHYLNLAINETFGITVIEAMARGCIPIAHKSGAIPEYLPRQFLYSSPEEAASLILETKKLVNERTVRKLKKIAYYFREETFRKRFIKCFNVLENMVK